MMTLSGFADEISPDLNEQLDVLESEAIRHIELRGVWEKNVLKLTDDELRRVKDELDKRGIRLSSVGSPLGKIGIQDDFEPHLKDLKRAIEVARFFECRYIRIFSFFIPKGEDPAAYRDEVLRRIRAMVKAAEEADVVLLHENEKEIYGDIPERCLDLHQSCPSPHLKAAFDPANFVQCGVKPFTDAYPLLRDCIEYVHIKDALFEGGKVVPAGEGNGEVKGTLQNLKVKGYNGFLSLEPHLASAGVYAGFSGAKLFKTASQALKKLLQEIGQDWN